MVTIAQLSFPLNSRISNWLVFYAYVTLNASAARLKGIASLILNRFSHAKESNFDLPMRNPTLAMITLKRTESHNQTYIVRILQITML